ncbi:hypothetical protein A2662_01220 [Candidatus Giovannonibacteria bacterium RIFCSPHIGHO2_01_FULL_45_33]|uniref:Uncharacterized protein n=1 Tax=Candidatus Giovannonibacteria bacterium RIFCSPLOWO2_01_FULL_45_34 TaxID=1798351 RepID=A0A1F5WZH4_9BACT|nr:MAG: hypothetical protein A2662_01220 [Candidatus Giovannonibacteria bacterium RIFCSPHIGHO2_01_FULL_45_33]OGF69216.1 MAG: hypothetical protein A3C73_00425 [Candidatus Giovannonibacteria bacterium RIFCSPHIGHO2_02_FULL_44_11]OGF81003.1 MAG: hypothetical protein A2930_00080 [Candidatus Giovannonibacteria bacterium RIFCSPLOWO2_01_FULL_45_34]
MLEKVKTLFKDPVFWDIFGLLTFSFIVVVAVWSLSTEEPFSRPLRTIFLLIGMAGLMIDSQTVWHRFVKKDK